MSIEEWFNELHIPNQRDHYSWLAELPHSHNRIATFGCMSGCEPFALLWILDAHEIMVVEVEEEYIGELNEQKYILNKLYPESLQGRLIESLCRDMRFPVPDLPDQYFDLAFCEDVLYALDIHGGTIDVNKGIEQMMRVVKPTGLIVAVESKYRAKFETRTSKTLGIPITVPVQKSEPENMHELFVSKGLKRLEVHGQPPYSYCYQRK